MSFRVRLASFLVASLAILQILTAVLVYEVTRREIVAEGQRQLAVAGSAFTRQLNDVSTRVADRVQVLTLDYALRSAIAQQDRNTVLSALRNHGRRVGATRMLLLGLDGTVEADTADGAAGLHEFPFTDLLNEALDRPAAAIVAWDGAAYWVVVVPVSAPALVGLIAAVIPIDNAFLIHLQEQSTLPKTIELVTQVTSGEWTVLASGNAKGALAHDLPAASSAQLQTPSLTTVGGREFVALSVPLHSSRQSTPILAVLGYSLDEALRPYRSVAATWTVLLVLGLLIGLIGSLLIARGVSRPVEALAATARRIGAGDYSPSPPIAQRDEIGELAAAFTNMTHAIVEREERLRYQSGHDAVTGLLNRISAESAIQQQLIERVRMPAALLMIGLARLPEIVKTMGHAIGDRLMREIGARIVQSTGQALVARATDTQFLVWMATSDQASAIALAFRILDVLGEPYREADVTVDVSPAVGIVLYPEHGVQASALLQRADVALFAALGSEDPVVVYEPSVDPHRPERLSLMGDLREALDQNQLQLHYQPKLNLSSGRIDGVEGLVRWMHPKFGWLAPDAFVPLAEETGNIRRLTRWVLAAGIAQVRRWMDEGRVLQLAMNLSARDLEDPELPRRVLDLLSIHGVPAANILLEVTESAVMGKPEAAVLVLKRLADQGIDLALDDFGVGQSSFAYMRRLPLRELKIDKSFMHKLGLDAENQTIVRSIVELGHRLGYRVTAEGVEDHASLKYLHRIGCDHAQGYFIARPQAHDCLDGLLVGRDPTERDNAETRS